jgi:hypothetical protein
MCQELSGSALELHLREEKWFLAERPTFYFINKEK